MDTDDLIIIEAIGPKISTLLHDARSSLYSKLIETDVSRLQSTLDDADLRFGNPATWTQQTKLAVVGEWVSLDEIQDKLKHGKRE